MSPTPAPVPNFTTNDQAAATRVVDYLEIGFPPATQGGAVTFERVPLATELGGFTPNNNVVRKPTYQGADGKAVSLVAVIRDGGNIQFSVAGKGGIRDRLLAASATDTTVLFKAHYDSAGLQVWGNARVTDRGIQGGRDDIPDWGFTLEATRADYVDKDGNLLAVNPT